MSTKGLFKPFSSELSDAIAKITSPDYIRKSHMHPVQMLLASVTYGQGHGMRGSGQWEPVTQLVDALDVGFRNAFANVTPSNKRIVSAIDESGSMDEKISGVPLSCFHAACVMAAITNAVEPNSQTVSFDTETRVKHISKTSTLRELTSSLPHGGGTDCASPIKFVADEGWDVDAIILYTDSETWAGQSHATQELARVRNRLGHRVRLVVVSMTATNQTVGDPKDPDVLQVVGFDASTPQVISAFINGEI
jgi:60 kDa SS-A/Ro ribonucleoprotein